MIVMSTSSAFMPGRDAVTTISSAVSWTSIGGVTSLPLAIVRHVSGLTNESSKRRSNADRSETISLRGSNLVIFAMVLVPPSRERFHA